MDVRHSRLIAKLSEHGRGVASRERDDLDRWADEIWTVEWQARGGAAMGWWRIDPETGRPLEGASSALGRPPDLVLLNAVPGVDDEEGACYLGDGPLDMVSTMPEEIHTIVGTSPTWSAEETRALFAQGRVPTGMGAKEASALRRAVDAFWADIDGCYEDDWERQALPGEKRWICEEVVESLTRRRT